MKLFKRILVSVWRRRVPSLVILLTTFLLGNVLAVSMSITQSAKGVEDNLLSSIGGKVSIMSDVSNPNQINIMSNDEYIKEMNLYYDVYQKLCDRDIVRYCDFSLHFENVALLHEEYSLPKNNNEMVRSLLHGIENENLLDELDGKITLIEGNRFTKEEIQNGDRVALVSNEVKYNGENIKVGDTIDFSYYYEVFEDKYEMHKGEAMTFEVVGIYQPVRNKYSDVHQDIYPFYVPNNALIELVKEYNQAIENKMVLGNNKPWFNSSIVQVHKADDLDLLIYAANAYQEKYGISYESTKSFVNRLLGPIETFSCISEKVFIFSLVAMTIVVGLISFYFIRDRKHEIGIYLSLGIKKIELILQIILETLCVGMLGILLSLGTGKVISEGYSNYLLDTTVTITNEERDKYTTGMMAIDPNNLNQSDIINDYEIVFTIEDIQNVFVLGGVTLILSSIFPLVYIMSLKPKNIMLE